MTRILIIDDQPSFRRHLQNLLAFAGLMVVGEAGSIFQALDLVRKHQPDLAVVDVMLPGMNGIVGVAELKSLNPHMRVILTSAYNLHVFHSAAQEAGAEAFIPKDELDFDVVLGWKQ